MLSASHCLPHPSTAYCEKPWTYGETGTFCRIKGSKSVERAKVEGVVSGFTGDSFPTALQHV